MVWWLKLNIVQGGRYKYIIYSGLIKGHLFFFFNIIQNEIGINKNKFIYKLKLNILYGPNDIIYL